MSHRAEPVQARARLSRRTLGRLGIATAAAALGVAGLAAESHREITHTRIAHLDLTSRRITGRAFRFVQVTDVHDLPNAGQRDAIVAMVRDARPDLVAVTGDLVSMNTTSLDRMEDFLARLAAVGVPLYFVPGNHEYANPRHDEIMAMVARHARVVLNSAVPLDGAWGRLDLVCVDDYYTGHGDLPAALRAVRPGTYRLVLTHSPQVFDDLSRADVDLAVCGHTHGGQVRLPGVGALFTPGGGFLPRLDKGLFPAGRAVLWIDSGVGQTLPPRLDDQSQITVATLAPA